MLHMMGHKTSLIGAPAVLVSTLSSAGPRLLWPATPLSRTTAHWCFMRAAATYKTADRGQRKCGLVGGGGGGWVGGFQDVNYRLPALLKAPEQSQSSRP